MAKIGPFLPVFTLLSKEVKLIFGQISAKYQAYSLTFWQKLANLCHFSLYNRKKSNWFLVKFRQNTKPIALLFDENWHIYATFHSTIKWSQIEFWSNFGKYQAYSLTFWRKWAKFHHFSLYNKMKSNGFLVKFRQNTKPIALLFGKMWLSFATFHSTIEMKSNWFLVKFRQNTKPIALLFGKNWPISATFHSTIKRSQIDFWSNFGKIPSL